MDTPEKLDVIEQILKKHIREQNEQNRRFNSYISSQEATNIKLIEEFDEVKRGLYGDPKNEVPGLIARQTKTEDSVKSLKIKQSRYIWWGSGVIAGINVALYFIKEIFTNK